MSATMWKLEKDLCRCCHAEGSFKHLSDPCFQLGQEEIYSDMLQDCLNIKIVPMTGVLSDVTYTICESCVVRLRDASNFKKQVQDCEERFKEMYSKNLIRGFEVKEEPAFNESDDMKQEFHSVDEDDDDAFMNFDDDPDDADDSLEDQDMITIGVEPKPKGKGKAKPKPKTKKPAPAKKTKAKDKSVKLESEDLTVAAVSGEKKKGTGGGQPNKELAPFCKVSVNVDGTKMFSCVLCPQRYSKRKRWTEHFRGFHQKLKKKTHPCVLCKEELLPRLRCRHMEECHGWPAPTCNECGRKFSYPSQVARHQREYHMGEKNVVCDQCGKFFPNTYQLKQHAIIHVDERKYKCDHCPKTFKLKTYLRFHVQTHSNEKTCFCDKCGKAFLNMKNLRQHAIRHKPEKNFKCEVCSKCYKTARYLRLHMKIHLNDKKHVCHICKAAYVQSNNLKYHLKTKHPEAVVSSEVVLGP